MKEILIYSSFRNIRLSYITDFLLNKLLGLKIELTSNLEYFQRAKVAKLNYSARKSETASIWMIPHPLMQEHKICSQDIIVRYENSIPFFFNTSYEADLSSDLFAASFYLLTRYEEYLDYEADKHGRFPAHQSLAYRAGFLERPMVQEWGMLLKKKLQALFPSLVFNLLPYQFQPTFDIDVAWAYQHRNWKRTIGAIAKDLVQTRRSQLVERIRVLLGFDEDPYEIYDQLAEIYKDSLNPPIFFFLLGKYGVYDKNISPTHPKLQTLIKSIHQNFPVGIHPSYASNEDIWQVRKEMKNLENSTHRVPLKSRQHYLKLHLPNTYRNLIKCGIAEDYSMGYADAVGFRASVACAFRWYDLEKEEITSLKIHPFQVMDVTLKEYMNLSPQAALIKIEQLIQSTRKFGGTFIPLWHNSSFSNIGGWEEWKAVHDKMVFHG